MNAILNISFSGFLPEIGDLFNLIVAGENSNFGFDEVNLIGARGFAPRMKTTKVCKPALKCDPPSASNIDPPEKGKKVSFCA